MARTHKGQKGCVFEISLGREETGAILIKALQGKTFEILLGHKAENSNAIIGETVCVAFSGDGRLRAEVLACEEKVVHNTSAKKPTRTVDKLTLRKVEDQQARPQRS